MKASFLGFKHSKQILDYLEPAEIQAIGGKNFKVSLNHNGHSMKLHAKLHLCLHTDNPPYCCSSYCKQNKCVAMYSEHNLFHSYFVYYKLKFGIFCCHKLLLFK